MKFYPLCRLTSELIVIENADTVIFLNIMEVTQALVIYV